MGDYHTLARRTMEIILPEGHIIPPEGCIIPPEGRRRPQNILHINLAYYCPALGPDNSHCPALGPDNTHCPGVQNSFTTQIAPPSVY